MYSRRVEFAVLWQDGTWTNEPIELIGKDANQTDELCVKAAHEILSEGLKGSQNLFMVGPMIYIEELQEDTQ